MAMFKLKQYQKDCLNTLEAFLLYTRTRSIEDSYATCLALQERSETYHEIFEEVPSVCLRVPTGGGKTLLAAHAIGLAGKAVLDSDAPVVLWLTPSDAIRAQTLECLSDARHPYRQALAQDFGERITVCDLESLQTVGPQDIGQSCIVVVATIQSFNITNTSKRNVYSFFEELAPHFDGISAAKFVALEQVTEEDLENQPFLTKDDIGRIKHSVANWLHMQRPVVIVDEAHNNRTDRFFQSLGRLNPSCVIELTATPVAGNNVLYHVSAAELKAEEMIKLPIVLAEHPDGWQSCIRDALLTRRRLETIAQKEPPAQHIRPIALIQAEPKGGEAMVDVVRQYLIDEENIPEDQIAVATGSQKELDGINLFDPSCQIRVVITIEALKEGWDCSFAYVLASLQSVNSAKDVEQLLGRVLRMPYASARKQEDLNKAYAHIVATSFAEAASNLTDRMVQNMGFERHEASAVLMPQPELELSGGNANGTRRLIPDCHIHLKEEPDTKHWPADVKKAVEIRKTSVGTTILIKGDLDSEALIQAEEFLSKTVKGKESKQAVKDQFEAHRAIRRSVSAPSQLGGVFAAIPQLCLKLDGYLEVVERDTLCRLGDWNLLDFPIQLEGFSVIESVNSFEIDVNGEQVKFRHLDTENLKLDFVESKVSEQDLVRWLDVEVRQKDISQPDLQAYLVKLVTHLTKDKGYTLTALLRARHQLANAIKDEIARLRQQAVQKGFQGSLFEMEVPKVEDSAMFSFQFRPGEYPARSTYLGRYEFKKHFYPMIHDLKEKTENGKTTEEFICAQILDAHPKVKQWVRNIERQPKFSFWLPTSTDYFYPDFVAELTDGKLLAVEYKGEPYKSNDDSREKIQVGEQWEKSSGGQCLFLFAVEKDDKGRDVAKQIADKLK